jgi:glutamine amidotransferase
VSVRIGICDVGLGNLRSVERALLRAAGSRAVEVVITRDPDALRRADKLVVPGQGGFRDCAEALAAGLGEVIRAHVAAGKPYFGICLGLQVLFETSEEAPGAKGLGLFAGKVVRLAGGTDPLTGAALKIPHLGWNRAEPRRPSPWLAAPTHFYFVHTFAAAPADPSIVLATTEYGAPFVSAIAKDNVTACQFHPEKSQSAGLAVLERFVTA